MGKLRQRALIIGEGPTEFFYFKSLCDVFTRLTIKPDYPKHTNIKELAEKIEDGINMGYSHIFCVIDMDTKDVEPEHSQYQRLKAKYAKPVVKPRKGIACSVEFFETHRCTELFFLYYFRYTSRPYANQEGLHSYFEQHGGNLITAVANSSRSMTEKRDEGRDYTYSELGRLIQLLNALG